MEKYLESAVNSTVEELKNMVNTVDIATMIFSIIITVILGIICTALLVKLTRKILKKSSRIDGALVQFITSIVKASCVVIIISIILQEMGVGTSTIIAVLGAAGAALALALKDSLANIAGGVMIIVTHPFKQGDLISVGENRGRVEHIDLFLTTIRTLDYRTITIPNGIINTSVVYNESNRDMRRADCHFTVALGTDIEQAKDILHAVCESSPLIYDDPKPVIGATGADESGIVLECLAYCKTNDIWDAKHYLNEAVPIAFEEAGITFAYPHLINDK